jgi:hypothetical protein
MPFHFIVDGKKHKISYSEKAADKIKDNSWRSKMESGYSTQMNFFTVVLDPNETTLAFMLPPAEVGLRSVLTTDSGEVFREKGAHQGSLYAELRREGAILRHKSGDEQVEVRFVYENGNKNKS